MIKRAIQLISILVFLLFALVVWVYQPILSTGSHESDEGANPLILEAHTRMLSEQFVPRDFSHPENLNRTAAYIRTEFEKTSGRVSEQIYDAQGETYSNVILELGPTIEESGSLIVLGAHYDAYDIYPAADDNASGVAGLLELGRMLDGAELGKTIQLVAFTLEEPPYFRTKSMGSAQHADALAAENAPVDLMISLEMIGYFNDAPNSQAYPVDAMGFLYPTTGDFIAVVGRMNQPGPVRNVKRGMLAGSTVDTYAIAAPPNLVPGIDFSDHRNYWAHDFPAVMVTDTAFNRNFAYHTPNDTADRLDYDRMAAVVNGIYHVVVTWE